MRSRPYFDNQIVIIPKYNPISSNIVVCARNYPSENASFSCCSRFLSFFFLHISFELIALTQNKWWQKKKNNARQTQELNPVFWMLFRNTRSFFLLLHIFQMDFSKKILEKLLKNQLNCMASHDGRIQMKTFCMFWTQTDGNYKVDSLWKIKYKLPRVNWVYK